MRYNQEVAVTVDEGGAVHGGVGDVDMCGDTFSECWFSRTGESFKAGYEGFFFCIWWDAEGTPGELCRGDVDAWVYGEEVGFGVRVVGEFSL